MCKLLVGNGIYKVSTKDCIRHAIFYCGCAAIFARMKNTPFTQMHTALGAKMVEFAGYTMPITYTGINEEHQTVRQNAGVFDVSHMGEFMLRGAGALDLIQRVTSNDASKLTAGKAQYSCLPNDAAGIVDDLIVYCLKENEEYMLVVNASNIEKDWNWIKEHNTGGVEMENISDSIGLLAVQGPKAVQYVQQLTDMDVTNLKYYTFAQGTFAGVEDVIVSATGYTGSGGVEIYFKNEGDNAQKIWDELFRVGGPQGMKAIGLAARDTLRLEMGYCLYGNDIDDSTSPLEAGLGWITKFSKDFTAKSILEAQKAEGIKRKLVGLEMIDKGIPRHDYKIQNAEGEEIGYITSGTQAPSLNKAIGMAYVRKDFAAEGSDVFVMIRDKAVKAQVVKMPFA